MSGDLTRSFNGSADEKLDRIISLVQSLDSRVAGLETTVQSLDSRVAGLETTIQVLDSRMSVLEEKVDARLRETQPLWERVLAEIAEVRSRQDKLQSGIEELRKDTSLGLQKVERQIMQLSKYWLEQRADIVMLQDRIEKLEGENIEAVDVCGGDVLSSTLIA
ncbi:MAG TPA: hypothetical protein VNO14_09235 [Blastocatellia bacterium]|nr:hypothetical protein [Blastocatellia bacterium]